MLSASVKLLFGEGLSQVTAARVHQSTGVARTTIYRHWPTQTDLILATLDRVTVPGLAAEITDDFEADLRVLLNGLKRRIERRPVRETVSATLAMAIESSEHTVVARRFLDGLLEPIRERIALQAQQTNMKPIEVERLYDRVVAPFLFRHVMMLGTIQPEQIDEVARAASSALGGR